jgi:hypothetical protein
MRVPASRAGELADLSWSTPFREDCRSRTLRKVGRPPSGDWEALFRNIGSSTAGLGSGPRTIRGLRVYQPSGSGLSPTSS